MVEENGSVEKEEHKAIREGSKFFEDDMLRVEFIFSDGYLATINIKVKDEDYMGKVDLSNKRVVSTWLTSANRAVVNILSSVPNTGGGPMVKGMEIIDAGKDVPPEKREMPPPITRESLTGATYPPCPRCKIELRYKENCCGGSGTIAECPTCGLKAKVRQR